MSFDLTGLADVPPATFASACPQIVIVADLGSLRSSGGRCSFKAAGGGLDGESKWVEWSLGRMQGREGCLAHLEARPQVGVDVVVP